MIKNFVYIYFFYVINNFSNIYFSFILCTRVHVNIQEINPLLSHGMFYTIFVGLMAI